MKAAKFFLIGLLQVTLLFATVACESDPDTEMSLLNPGGTPPEDDGNPYWDWVDAFPGPVSLIIEPKVDAIAKVRGGFDPIVYSPETPILQSTGLWARNSELIEVYVPEGVENLCWQIGIGQPLYDISIQSGQRRYRDVTTKGELNSGETNIIKSNFGGFIYFYYEPEDMPESSDYVEVIVNKAVEAYSYIYGETDNADYMRTMQNRADFLFDQSSTEVDLAFVPWTELISDKMIITLGVKEMSLLANPKDLLDVYGKMRDAYFRFVGYDDEAPNQAPMRIVSDIQLPNPLQTNSGENNNRKWGGYPMVSYRHTKGRERQWEDERGLVNESGQLEFRATSAFTHVNDSFAKTVFGDPERGWASLPNMHWPLTRLASLYYSLTELPEGTWLPGYLRTQFDAIISSNVNYPPNKFRYNRGDYVFAMASGYSNDAKNNNPYTNFEKQVDNWWDKNTLDAGMTTMFVQLATEYGWDLVHYLFTRAREIGFVNEIQQDAMDYIVMACCEFTNTDLRPFFQWYHYEYSEWASEFIEANNFQTLPGTFTDIGNPYFFITNTFPREPDIPETTGLVPNRIDVWPAKRYYKRLPVVYNTNRDWSQNDGWYVTGGFDIPDITGPDVNGTSPYVLVDEMQRIVNNTDKNYNAEWFQTRHIMTSSQTEIRTPTVMIEFLKERQNDPITFNALEIMASGWNAPTYFSFVYGLEVFVPDDLSDPDPETPGEWIPAKGSGQDPTLTGNWYDGVIWSIPHRDHNGGGPQSTYVYYLDKTYTGTKFRFKFVTCLSGRDTNNGPTDPWTVSMKKVYFGLMSSEVDAPPAPGDSGYVPRYTYQGKLNTKGSGDNESYWWQLYEDVYRTDPSPTGFKGWLNTGIRDYTM